MALSTTGLSVLARRDRASVSKAITSWSVEPVDGEAPSCCRSMPRVRSRPLGVPSTDRDAYTDAYTVDTN